jgi:sugar phosphate permease
VIAPELRPMRAYRWTALAIGCLAQGIFGFCFFPGLASIGPAIGQHFQIDLLKIGFLFSALLLGPVLTLLAWGYAVDRWGDRLAMTIGLLGGGLALLAASFSTAFPAVVVELAAGSMLAATTSVAGSRIVIGWFDARERGLAMGIRQMSALVGGGLAALVMPGFTTAFGIPALFVLLSGTCGIGAVAAAIGIRTPPVATPIAATDRRSLVSDQRMWHLAVGAGVIVLGQNCLVAYAVIFLTDYRHLPLQVSALIFLTAQLGGGVARVVAGNISDRMQLRIKPIRWGAVGASALVAGVAATAPLSPGYVVAILVMAMMVVMIPNGLAYIAGAELAGADRAGAAVGMLLTVFAVAGVAAPILFGFVVTGAGWPGGFLMVAALGLAGWAVLAPLARTEAEPTSPARV